FLTATPTASTYSLSLHDALPIFAAFEVLFLPDRRHELERVDARMARFDRVAPMRSGDCDADAGFPERNDSDPVHDRNAHELPFPHDFGGDFFELENGHFGVCLVFELEHLAAAVGLARRAEKSRDSAGGR